MFIRFIYVYEKWWVDITGVRGGTLETILIQLLKSKHDTVLVSEYILLRVGKQPDYITMQNCNLEKYFVSVCEPRKVQRFCIYDFRKPTKYV